MSHCKCIINMRITPQDMLQWNFNGDMLAAAIVNKSCLVYWFPMYCWLLGPCAWVPSSTPPRCRPVLEALGMDPVKQDLQPKWKLCWDTSPSISDHCLSLISAGSHGRLLTLLGWQSSLSYSRGPVKVPPAPLRRHRLLLVPPHNQ